MMPLLSCMRIQTQAMIMMPLLSCFCIQTQAMSEIIQSADMALHCSVYQIETTHLVSSMVLLSQIALDRQEAIIASGLYCCTGVLWTCCGAKALVRH